MTNNPELRALVLDTTDKIYTASAKEFGLAPGTDVSHSNKCHTLTLDLMNELQRSGYPIRRELHMDAIGNWHYIVAHSEDDPTDQDIITDMNPWFYSDNDAATGLLHGERTEVMDILRDSGVHAGFIALRSLATIILPHTKELLTEYTHPPLLVEDL